MERGYQVLLDLFERVGSDPDGFHHVPVEDFPAGSAERRLLEGFRTMLGRVQGSRKQQSERYEQLVNTIDGIVWEADARTVEFSFVSPQAERLLGYPASRWVAEPTFWQDHIHPDDREWAIPFCATAVAELRPHQFEYRLLAADGRTVWVRDIVSVVAEDGRPPRLRGVMVDITERKRTEEALERLRRQHELILKSAGEGIYGVDRQGLTTFVNPAAARMLGWEPEELIGKFGHGIVHHSAPDGTPIPPEACPVYAATLSDGTVHTADTELFWRKDGTSFPVEYISTPIWEDGEIVGAVVTFRDISERKQAEAKLREKEEEYRSIFEATSDGLIINDLETGTVVAANPAVARMHGYTVEEFVGLHPTTFIHPEHHGRFHEYVQAARQGRDYRAQAMDVRKDGTVFPVEVHGTGFIYQGRRHILGVVRDITERKQAEEALRQSEAEMRALLTAMRDVIMVIDRNGRFRKVGPNRPDLLMRPPEVVVGQSMHEIFPPEQADEFLRQVRETLETGKTHELEYRLDLPVGERWFSAAHSRMDDELVVVVARDITERVRAAEQLREKEEQYRSIFEATSDGLVITDPEAGRIVAVNPAFARMHGYGVEECIGLDPTELIPAAYRHLYEEQIGKVRAGGEFRAQAVGLRKDGAPVPLEVHGTSFTYLGKPHVLVVARDITERVQAYQLLEQRVEERTRELSTLLNVSQNVVSTLELRPLLDLILEQLRAVADYDGANVSILEGEELVIAAYQGPFPQEQIVGIRRSAQRSELIWQRLEGREYVLIGDIQGDEPLERAYRRYFSEYVDNALKERASTLLVPLVARERVIGFLGLYHRQPGYYTQHHADLVLAIANQAAGAIENARLYEQAQALAALEERQRLARELHDSVSQALYGIALGTRTARTLLERNQSGVAEALEYVASLAAAGLAEMRALIFELRPESLETEGLVAALTKQAASLQARHRIEVLTELPAEPDLPIETKEVLYRIAQEALHNTVKHAQARRVSIRLRTTARSVTLDVKDDGVGFDPTASFPGHLGLHSMRERVARLGGSIAIESAPGKGAVVRVRLPRHGATASEA